MPDTAQDLNGSSQLKNSMSNPGKTRPDMQSFMHMMDVASELRKQREIAGEQFEVEQTREDLRKRLRATADVTGENLSDGEIDAAIDSFFSGLYRFKKPEKDLNYRLASLYVNRKNILKLVLIPVTLVGLLFAGIWSAEKTWKDRKLGKEEIRIEQQVESISSKYLALNKRYDLLNSESKEIPKDKNQASLALAKAAAVKDSLASYFQKFSKNGRVDKNIDSSNMKVAEAESGEIKNQLEKYEAAISTAELSVANFKQLEILPAEIESTLKGAISVAKTEDAQAAVRNLQEQASALEGSSDANALQDLLERSRSTFEKLKQDYRIEIVNRAGVKSGIDRFFTDKNGRRVPAYYLIVEATDSSGQTVPMNVNNAETGASREVKVWGEQVPESVYTAVKKDKVDDGIINNRLFGFKKAGALTEQIVYPGTAQVDARDRQRITRW